MPAARKRTNKLAILALGFIALVTLIFFSKSNFWNGKDKLILTVNRSSGVVLVAVFDPLVEEIISFTIPKNTEVAVSRGLGTLRIRNVWQLGVNEGADGALLAETVSKNFHFPTYIWADEPAYGFVEGDIVPVVRAVFSRYMTNLSLVDRAKIGLFSLSVKGFKKENFDLSETKALRKKILKDGQEGYVIVDDVPEALISVFSDPEISGGNIKVGIYNATGEIKKVEEVGEIIEVLGAKITAVVKEPQADFDCEVSGKDKKTVRKIARVFACQEAKAALSNNFDLEIRLGRRFAARF